jgi:hypothetical protein
MADGDVGSIVTDPSGPVNSGDGTQFNASPTHHGSGDQHNYSVRVFEGRAARFAMDNLGRRSSVHRIVAADRLVWLRKRFIAAPGYDESYQRRELDRFGALVLCGAAGSGLRTTAQMTLVPEGHEEQSGLREIDVEGERRLIMDIGDVQPGERLMLDLTRSTGADPDHVKQELETLRTRVLAAGAWLLVLLDAGEEHRLPDEFRDRVVQVGRPNPLRVLAAHLEGRGVHGFFPGGASERLSRWAGRASMSEIEELARRTAALGTDMEGGVGEWLQAALGSKHSDVAALLDGAGGRGRAILLAAAFLEGSRIERHSAAVERLLPIVRTPGDDTPPLERRAFTKEVDVLGVEIDSDRRIRFRVPGYGLALRETFWDAYPHLHEEFAAWVDSCVADSALPGAERDDVAGRWAGQVLRARQMSTLLTQVGAWSERHQAQSALLLAEALGDGHQGRAARHQIYTWSRKPNLPSGLAQVLVTVCAEVLAVTRPDQALVRLHLLAGNNSPRASTAARSALLELAEDPLLYRHLLRRVSTRLTDTERRHRQVDLFLFRELTGADRLTSGPRPQVRRAEVLAWTYAGLAAVFAQDPDGVEEYGTRWLSARDLPLDVLVAAAQEKGRLSRLYVTALRCPGRGRAPEDREFLRDRSADLIRLIDTAQGLDLEAVPQGKETV